MELSLKAGTGDGPAVLAVSGEVDVHSAPDLGDRIAEVLGDGQHRLVVDLNGVEFMDSTGLGVLVAGYNRAQELGGTLELVCEVERVTKLLRITGLDDVFTIHPTPDDSD